MAKNFIIFVLLVIALASTTALIRLENFHYAVVVGMCSASKSDDLITSEEKHPCLHRTATRSNVLWHIYYAVTGE